MRTKHLLTALMLPAVFAACTQEEYDVVDNSAKMNERIELGQVALDFGGAESRFAAGTGNDFNGFVPEEGDVLGDVGLVFQHERIGGLRAEAVQQADMQIDLLADLAQKRFFHGFVGILSAAGQIEIGCAVAVGAAVQQDLVAADEQRLAGAADQATTCFGHSYLS